MGLLTKIFQKSEKEREMHGYFKTLTAYQPVYTTFEGGLYEMELTRAAINGFARHVSKLRPELIGDARPELGLVLATHPNPWMDTAKFLARTATIFEVQNNAFLVPLEDRFGRCSGYYPILPQRTEIREFGGAPYLRYQFSGGQWAAIEFERAGLLTQHQYSDDFFGETNRVMLPTLQLMHTQDEGIANAIKNATTIRFFARLAGTFKDKDVRAERQRFADLNFSSNDTGVMFFDQKYADVKQVESLADVVNPKQQELIRDSVFEYFGTNAAILTNTYDEEKWNAYYEGKIEPFAIQLSLVMSAMTFTPEELAAGAGIIFTTNRLQYASNKTKLDIVTQLFDRGFLTHNQGREIFNMSPIDGGDKYFIRREYSEVSKLDSKKEGETDGVHA